MTILTPEEFPETFSFHWLQHQNYTQETDDEGNTFMVERIAETPEEMNASISFHAFCGRCLVLRPVQKCGHKTPNFVGANGAYDHVSAIERLGVEAYLHSMCEPYPPGD